MKNRPPQNTNHYFQKKKKKKMNRIDKKENMKIYSIEFMIKEVFYRVIKINVIWKH